ncbi:MAG: hypothetical protein K2Y37_06730 [Pirellulales bacterium]|nr:hypothetical protein [Pirellulales bacterium]
MPDPQGQVAFAGIDQVIAARFRFAPGAAPSTCWLDIVPQAELASERGTLELSCGDTYLAFPDCQIDRASLVRDGDGNIERLALLDRRWQWNFANLSAHFNQRHDDATLVAGTERSPDDLAQLCFDALGELAAETAPLASASRPTFQATAAPAAELLDRLAARLGCRVALGLDNTARVCALGAGLELPISLDVMRAGARTVGPARPGRLRVVGGRTRYQCDLRLEAVGLDQDGEVRPLDELTYAPSGGWSTADLEHLQAIADRRLRELALASVFRWYRVVPPLALPAAETLTARDRFLPYAAGQVELDDPPSDMRPQNRPAVPFGVWCDYPWQSANRATSLAPIGSPPSAAEARTIVTTPFVLDTSRGLVKFAAPVIRYVAGDRFAPAELVLRTSIGVRELATQNWRHWQHDRELVAGGTTVAVERVDELVQCYLLQYDPGTYALSSATDNAAALTLEAEAYLDALERRHRPRTPQFVEYAGLVPLEPDGSIDAVEWSIGPRGTTTRAWRDTE